MHVAHGLELNGVVDSRAACTCALRQEPGLLLAKFSESIRHSRRPQLVRAFKPPAAGAHKLVLAAVLLPS
eukprot:5499958-Pleurochrysis_carterae.AAC.1